jgi:hypothetical protein
LLRFAEPRSGYHSKSNPHDNPGLSSSGGKSTMAKIMGERLGVLFLHHDVDEITRNNLRSIQTHNPDLTLATISGGKPLPGGYSIDATPDLKALHGRDPATSDDFLICSWLRQRRERCDRWWIVEWDVFCRVSIRDYYAPVWDFPFVASAVRLPFREPQWYWFRAIQEQTIPAAYQPYIMGTVPTLYLMSETALSATCAMLLREPLPIGNCEVRFTTAANRCGYPPCGFSPPDDRISWIPWKAMPPDGRIVHPVKFLHPLETPMPVQPSCPPAEPREYSTLP